MSKRIVCGLIVAVCLLAVPVLASVIYHAGGAVVVDAEEAAFSLRNADLEVAWPSSGYRCAEVTICNLDEANTCEVRWRRPDNAESAWVPLLPQPTAPFCINSKADGLDSVSDAYVNTETSRGNDSCTLIVRCAVERR